MRNGPACNATCLRMCHAGDGPATRAAASSTRPSTCSGLVVRGAGALRTAYPPISRPGRRSTAAVQAASREAGRVVRLTDPAAVEERNARLAANPEAPMARFDWLRRYVVERAMADEGEEAAKDAG